MPDTVSAGERLLRRLGEAGVPYLFGNAGTDAAPLIEGYARCKETGAEVPTPILATHEGVALSMAHGYAMVSGNLPAAFVHVSVGTANAACAVMNTAREHVPVLFMAGRTPIFEDDTTGSRDAIIHWGQEMFDQGSLVREFVKWDYELRGINQIETVVDRAASIAMSEPRGPVYLTLPREVLSQEGDAETPVPQGRLAPARPARADADAVEEAAAILASATCPVIIAGNSGRDPAAFAALSDFAERFSIPVVAHRSRYLALPTDHPMHLGFDPTEVLAEADAVLVLEADVPWIPKLMPLAPKVTTIHVGHDPLFGGIPIRGFRCDLAITSGTASFLADLGAVLSRSPAAPRSPDRAAAAREALADRRASTLARAKGASPIHPAWVSQCLNDATPDDTIAISEYSVNPDFWRFSEAGTFFASSSASGLGWGMGAALGAKLAEPDRLVVSVQGDGAYIFSNPVAAHYASHQHDLPVLFVVVNNAMWNAVRVATRKVYPDGAAARSNLDELTHLDGLPAFDQICAAAGGYGERVEAPEDLPGAIQRALHAVRVEKRQALLNVICQTP